MDGFAHFMAATLPGVSFTIARRSFSFCRFFRFLSDRKPEEGLQRATAGGRW